MSDNDNTKYIYESPDKGKTVYSRKFGDSKRKLVKKDATLTTTVTTDGTHDEVIGTVPVTNDVTLTAISATEDIGWNNSYEFAPGSTHTPWTTIGDKMGDPGFEQVQIAEINRKLEVIDKRLAILYPNEQMHKKFEGLKQLYNEYKAMEKLLSGPDSFEEE